MSVGVERVGLDVLGRLYTVCTGQIATVLTTVPTSANPLEDLDGDDTKQQIVTPVYRYALGGRVPFPVNEDVCCFLYRKGHSPGQRASSGPTTYKEVERRIPCGIYIRIMHAPVTPEPWPTTSTRTLEWAEQDWYRTEVYAHAHEYMLHRYLADGTTILDAVDVTLVDMDVAPANNDVREHLFARIEFDALTEANVPVNRFDV